LLNVVIELIDPGAANMITAGNQIPAPANSFPSNGGTASLLATLSGGGQQSQIQPVNGYLVDNNGLIEIPIIGKIKATGLTIYSLKDTIVKVASKYYKNPVVVVRFANFKVDIAGEVLKPGQYVMPEEKETILDAISMAGDLTIFGKRENVLLLRENTDGSKTAYRINLKKSNVMSSPAYYLQQNDVIYVEPRKAKSDATDAAQTRYITIASAVLSILVIIATRTK
jgi:polysaccharide export outer membrane protein